MSAREIVTLIDGPLDGHAHMFYGHARPGVAIALDEEHEMFAVYGQNSDGKHHYFKTVHRTKVFSVLREVADSIQEWRDPR